MSYQKLKPCPFCGSKAIIETWKSGGNMFMVKCPNPDCPVPNNSYPKGRILEEVKREWNKRAGESE